MQRYDVPRSKWHASSSSTVLSGFESSTPSRSPPTADSDSDSESADSDSESESADSDSESASVQVAGESRF